VRLFHFFNAITIICVMVAIYIVYYLLLEDNLLHLSISSIIKLDRHLTKHGHFFIIGLLPIYIACMIFGALSIAIYISAFLQRCLKRFFWKNSISPRVAL